MSSSYNNEDQVTTSKKQIWIETAHVLAAAGFLVGFTTGFTYLGKLLTGAH